MVYPNNINLNLNTQYVLPIPTAQQGDTARVLTFNILDKGVPFNLEGKTVRAKILKPDNTKCYNDLTITNATGGECDLKLTNQVLAVAGTVNCQLEIKEGEELLSTIIFSIDVEPSIDINGAVESTNEFTTLENGIIKLDEWDKYFKETSGKFEEKYTERLNGIDASLEEKVNKEQGKGLSTNDYTNIDKAEVAKVKDKLDKVNLLDLTYPIGAIYISANNTNPANLFGGEWIEFAKGKTLIGVDTTQTEFNTVLKTGGSKTMIHNHGAGTLGANIGAFDADITSIGYQAVSKRTNDSAFTYGFKGLPSISGSVSNSRIAHNTPVYGATDDSSSSTSNNLQPYITCYMWKRTA